MEGLRRFFSRYLMELEVICAAVLITAFWSSGWAQDGTSADGVTTAATIQLMIETAIAGAGAFVATWIYKKGLPKLGITVNPKSLPWVARGISVFGLAGWKVFDAGFSWKAIGQAAVLGLAAAYGASKSHDVGSTLLAKKK